MATTYYFQWGTTTGYGNTTATTSAGSGSASVNVSAPITGLIPGTPYHFRIVATNSDGTSNGNDLSFTAGGATVITTAASAIGATTATSGGNVTGDGGSVVTARGVCWSTSANPTISGSHTTDGSGLGVFISSLTGLTANTGYHIRAYATTGNGTFYGDDLVFTTLCGLYSLPFTEAFTNIAIPSCWSQIDHQGNGQIWQFGVITNESPLPALTGNYAYLNSDAYGTGNSQNADLITPMLDLSAYTGITLQFNHYFRSYSGSSGTLSYSINNGTTWTQIQQFTTTTANPAAFSQVIAGVAGQSQVKFKWNYTGNWAWYWGIDDIQLTGSCISTPPVTVSIAASLNPVDAGTPVTFTATPANAGTAPVYQWKVNGAIAGTNNVQFTYVPVTGDQVSCVLTSSAVCVSGNPATSNTITMVVNSVPVSLSLVNMSITGTQCFNATQTITVAGASTTFTVQNGAIVTMIAGQNILFYPQTTVVSGGYLHGYIAPGGPFCQAPAAPQVLEEMKGLPATQDQFFFTVYPNPTPGAFTVALNEETLPEHASVVIYNMNGNRIISTGMSSGMKHEFSLSGMPSGIYLIQVIAGQRTGTARILKH